MTETGVVNVFKYTGTAGILGAVSGGIYGALRDAPIRTTSFYMFTNWTLVTLPFFAIRETTLDRDELLASTISGSICGSAIGYLWRRSPAIIPGAIIYSLVAASGQSVFIGIRNWRINIALQREKQPLEPITDPFSKYKGGVFINTGEIEPTEFDPARKVFSFVQLLFPESLSFLRYAVDLDYRKKLNFKIEVLSQQIEDLNGEIKQKSV
ncbi:hypothetical protein HDV01_006172 [Terramyces sp. JEL0728]|nr:hypothetical protein HDV01_006172 [Terramyces sp. JEL0728]